MEVEIVKHYIRVEEYGGREAIYWSGGIWR